MFSLFGHPMRCHLLVILLCVTGFGCRTPQAPSPSVTSAPTTPPDVISAPLSWSAALTPPQVESIRSLLSRREFKEMAALRAALPDGLRFMGVSYAFVSPLDANGRPSPYTEAISVCRLSEDRDLVIVEDNRTGKNIIRNWFIRDLPTHK